MLALLDVAEAIGRWVLVALVEFLNLVIAAIGGVITVIMSLLPGMPDVPEAPDAVEQANWFVPVATVVGIAMAWLTLLVLWWAFRIVLRQLRAAP